MLKQFSDSKAKGRLNLTSGLSISKVTEHPLKLINVLGDLQLTQMSPDS